MDVRRWRVGELAAATGLTVRTLHHFDEIGLLHPAERSSAEHRLYTSQDVRRLHRILALRHLGVPLGDIAGSLDGVADDLAEVVRRQLESVERTIAAQHDVRRRIAGVMGVLGTGREPSAEQLIDAMEAVVREPYVTGQQRARWKRRHGADGGALAEWQRRAGALDADARRLAQAGVDPSDAAALDLARRWSALMDDMSGGDRAVVSSIYAKLDGKGPEAATRGAVSVEAWEFVKRALAVGFGA